MGRAMRWLKKVLTGAKKEGERGRKEQHNAACAGGGLPPVEKRRWSFAKPRHSVADGGRRPSVTAVAAGELSQVRPCNCGLEREAEAAVVIQKAFRGYLVSCCKPNRFFVFMIYCHFSLLQRKKRKVSAAYLASLN